VTEKAVFSIAVAAAILSWSFVVYNWVLAVRNRRPTVSLLRMFLQGTKSFDPANFTSAGQKYRRRLLLGFAAFFASLFVGLGVVIYAVAKRS
jgi:hypothetical protein